MFRLVTTCALLLLGIGCGDDGGADAGPADGALADAGGADAGGADAGGADAGGADAGDADAGGADAGAADAGAEDAGGADAAMCDCDPSSCEEDRTCGRSPCGISCGACDPGESCVSRRFCRTLDASGTCPDAYGEPIPAGEWGFRVCPTDPALVQRAICEGAPDIWIAGGDCVPPC